MFDMFGGFNASKLKPQLKMAVSRFNIASNKKAALLKQNMRAVAVLLAEDPPKEEMARIKAESLIRDDNLVEAYEILQLECELLSERIKLIEFSKECPPDLISCVSTLIYAAPRVDITELQTIRKQFRAKYGKKFEENALNNVGGVLNERVITKLSIQPPAANLVQTYLELICNQFEVDWSPHQKLSPEQMVEPMAPPIGYSVQIAQGTGLGENVVATTGTSTSKLDTTDENKATGEDNWTLPPAAPGSASGGSGPGKPGSGSGGAGSGGGGGGGVYVPSSAHTAHTTLSSHSQEQKNDFEEPDVFIPAIPSAPVGGSVGGSSGSGSGGMSNIPPSAPSAPPGKPDGNFYPVNPSHQHQQPTKQDNRDDDDNKNDGYNPSGSGSGSGGVSQSTYDDLAARFDKLHNM